MLTVLLLLEMSGLVFLFLKSRRRKDLLPVSSKRDLLGWLEPLFLEMMRLLRHDCRMRFELKLEAALRELEGATIAHVCVCRHMARKFASIYMLIIGLTLAGIFGTLDSSMLFMFFTAVLLLFYLPDRALAGRVAERRRSIQLDFPDFLNKLIMLVNAGQTITAAISRISRDCEKHTPLYVELGKTVNEINGGKTELQAFEDFAKRCRTQEAAMFASALIQNLRKGADGLVPVLRLQAATCWEGRKNLARKLGEEASTRLLFPLMLIFAAILIMVMTPAVMQMNI